MPLDEPRVRDIVRVLCRIPVPRGQLLFLHLLAAHPDGLTSDAYKKALGSKLHDQMGVLGAFARRVNHTHRETEPDGKPGARLLLQQRWTGKVNVYRPRPELFEALERLPTLREAIGRPLEELDRTDEIVVPWPDGFPRMPPDTDAGGAEGGDDATGGAGSTGGTGSTGGPTTRPFDALLAGLDASGLVFPAELVANVLLALQVKRFVILTGISGTGKTRIGQALAARYATTRRAARTVPPDERTAILACKPYMRDHHRMTLPAALAAQLAAPLETVSSIQARWPGGAGVLSASRSKPLMVFFKGAMRAWFDATFPLGAPILVRLEGPVEGPYDTLAFEVPTPTIEETRVENHAVIAVRPDWTDRRGLLGHVNPLTRSYVVTPFLELLLRARDECAANPTNPTPFFALLDEMNLARVEHYFSDLLSALESGEAVHLHDVPEIEEGEDEGPVVPRRLPIPRNLFLIGTVNVDESTYLFSPKVLDRAFAIEFDAVDLRGLGRPPGRDGTLDLARWSGRLDVAGPPTREDWRWLEGWQEGDLSRALLALHDTLTRFHRHFGYRVATEIARYVRLAADQAVDPEAASWAALDLGVLQKVLVKLNGTQAELQDVVDALLGELLAGGHADPARRDRDRWALDADGELAWKDEAAGVTAALPRSAAKLWRMRERLVRQGFTSWIE